MKVFLIGYRCTGKTTVGKRLAERLGVEFLDTDQLVERQVGSSIAHLVATRGWDVFRQIETQVLKDTAGGADRVIATGGGIIMDPQNGKFIKETGFSIWLDADIKTILSRLGTDSQTAATRPALTDKDLLEETKDLVKLRSPLYAASAHMRIDTGSQTPEQIVNIIERRVS